MGTRAGAENIKKGAVPLRVGTYLITVTLLFFVVSILCATYTEVISPSQEGMVDLTGIDFGREIVRITSDAIHIYDLNFYTPEDFASGKVTGGDVRFFGVGPSLTDYGTIRILLKLPQGKIYAISSKNTSYAQRMFINGREYPAIGVTGDNAEAVTPKATRYTAAFQPENNITEIILHYSNFVHSDTGGFYPIKLGSIENITRSDQSKTIQITAVTTALVTSMLFFFGMFLFFGKSRYFLWFSMTCACVSLRGLLIDDKVIMLLMPNLNWYIAIRLEYLATCGMSLFSALYLNALFPRAANKWAVRGYACFCGLNAAFICFTQPLFFTRFVTETIWIYALFDIYLIASIFVSVIYKKRFAILLRAEQILLLTGFIIYLLLSALGIYAHIYYASPLWNLDYPETGMMVFLFINILALTLGFARTERELDEVRRSEREIAETNKTLERLNSIKSNFLDNISHEMKTPLTIIGNYADTTIRQIKKNAVDTGTIKNLGVIQQEAQWLGRLVERSKSESVEKEWRLTLTDTDAKTLLLRAADSCNAVCRRKGNRIAVKVDPEMIPLRADADGIYRVLFNLAINANRHTNEGIITFNTELNGNEVVFAVSDTGDGFNPELLPRVFQRGVSGDGGSGFGLAICKEIVEQHGGKIEVQRTGVMGSSVRFMLPFAGEGDRE